MVEWERDAKGDEPPRRFALQSLDNFYEPELRSDYLA